MKLEQIDERTKEIFLKAISGEMENYTVSDELTNKQNSLAKQKVILYSSIDSNKSPDYQKTLELVILKGMEVDQEINLMKARMNRLEKLRELVRNPGTEEYDNYLESLKDEAISSITLGLKVAKQKIFVNRQSDAAGKILDLEDEEKLDNWIKINSDLLLKMKNKFDEEKVSNDKMKEDKFLIISKLTINKLSRVNAFNLLMSMYLSDEKVDVFENHSNKGK